MVKCILQCDTGRQFAVDITLLKKSVVLSRMMTDLNIGQNADVELDEEPLPLENISELCMEKMIEWLEYHKDDPEPQSESESKSEEFTFSDHINEWDMEFLQIDDATLFGLIIAANYLEIRGLLDLTTTYVAKMIADLDTPEDIRKRFNITNDLTPEDLEEIKKESERWLNDDVDETAGATGGATGGTEEMEVGEEAEDIEEDPREPMPSTSGHTSGK